MSVKPTVSGVAADVFLDDGCGAGRSPGPEAAGRIKEQNTRE